MAQFKWTDVDGNEIKPGRGCWYRVVEDLDETFLSRFLFTSRTVEVDASMEGKKLEVVSEFNKSYHAFCEKVS